MNPRTDTSTTAAAIEAPGRPCNLSQWVTPNHWDVSEFEPFRPAHGPAMALDAEFNLIAPVLIYHAADLKYKPEARAALKQLVKAGHPIMDGLTANEVLESETNRFAFDTRYNALVMAIANDEIFGIESHIDQWGAFSFTIADDKCVLAGDDQGFFAFHLSAGTVRNRLNGGLHALPPSETSTPAKLRR